MADASSTHACRACGEEFPATTEFFYRAGAYFNWICKPCMIAYVGSYKRKRAGRPGERPVQCEHCGSDFVSARRIARHCTLVCHIAARHAQERADRLAAKVATPRTCVRCGSVLSSSMRSDAKFCSSACNEKAHSQTRQFRRRSGATDPRSQDEPLVSLAYIAERDAWKCGLCGGRVDPLLCHPDPHAPSIDHVVPLAIGGTNDLANLQLAHLRCNLAKRDRPCGEQLRIVG